MPFSAHSTVSDSIQGTLAQHAGQAPDANAVVDAVTRTWRFMADQLEPVIGVRGTGVLLDRALHLTAQSFPWLAQSGPPDDASDPLQARFVRRDAHEAAQAGCTLLVTFTEQLSSLIGEALTERLLASVWVGSASPYETHTPHG